MKRFILSFMFLFSVQVAQAETLKLATLNWEPFYGESLPEFGFYAVLTVTAFKRAGYPVELDFVSWKRAVENAKLGSYDGLMGAYFTEERTPYFAYTDVMYTTEEVLIKRQHETIVYQQMEDLKPYIIGGLRASAPLVSLQEQGYKIQPTTSELASLQKLLLGRIDLVLMGKEKFKYDTTNHPKLSSRANEFEILEPAYKSYEMFNTISRKRSDAEEITRKFNAALKEMQEDGTYAAILKRFNQQ